MTITTTATAYAVAAAVADVRRDPDPASELVTQALLNASATADLQEGEWIHVRLSDYEGWIHSQQLEEPIIRGFCKVSACCATPLPLIAVVTVPYCPLFATAEGGEVVGKLYLSTALPPLDLTHPERIQVALPGEQVAWLQRSDSGLSLTGNVYPRAPLRVVTDCARAFLGRPYLWGGTSWEGIDCSAFVQLCYRMGGFIIPRDADQQHDFLSHSVPRAEMQEGDLIFFGSKAITHVALALNSREYIHAEGQNYDRVLINSFDAAAPHYYPRLDEIVWAIKRVITEPEVPTK
jgi:gamma-D-glutamyl-L-lysine dipeptidyl-peptidase